MCILLVLVVPNNLFRLSWWSKSSIAKLTSFSQNQRVTFLGAIGAKSMEPIDRKFTRTPLLVTR